MHETQTPLASPPPYPHAVLDAPPLAGPPLAPPQPLPIVDPLARRAAIALLVSGAVLLVGLIARSWFTTHGGRGSVGVLGLEECRSAVRCMTMTWFDVPRAPLELKLFATVGLLGGLTAIGFLIHAAAMLMRQQAGRVKLLGVHLALSVAALGCFGFFFHLALGEMARRLSMSWAGFFAMGGILAASAIATIWVRPLVRVSK